MQMMNPQLNQVADDSLMCFKVCSQTMSHCLEMGGRHVDADHMNVLEDCAEICALTANYASRNAQFHRQIASLCMDICNDCARSCEAVDPNDEMMMLCADACRQCAQSCSTISGGRRAA